MMDATGQFFRMMGGGYGAMMDPTLLLVYLVVKLVISFLFVWLCVWLLDKWGWAPFGKRKR